MWKRVTMLGLIAAIAAAPSAAAARPGHGVAVRVAAQTCAQERQHAGREAFAAKYERPAMRRCIREILPEARNAAQECRQERGLRGVDAFRDEYGVPTGARNAFGKCVSGKVAAGDKPDEPAEGESQQA
jgi:hypothetical protein